MSILSLLFTLIVVGVVLYLVNSLIPMDGKVKQILNVVVILLLLLWLAQVFGLLSGNVGTVRIGR